MSSLKWLGFWKAQLGWWSGAFLLHGFKFSQCQSAEAWRGPHRQRECRDQPQVKRLSLKPFVCSEKGRIVGDHIWRQFPQEDELGKDINCWTLCSIKWYWGWGLHPFCYCCSKWHWKHPSCHEDVLQRLVALLSLSGYRNHVSVGIGMPQEYHMWRIKRLKLGAKPEEFWQLVRSPGWETAAETDG